MLHLSVTFILCLATLQTISSQNLNGIYVTDSCKCNSSKETCEPNGPFIFNHKQSTIAVKYGSIQVGVGTLGNNQLNFYLNQNRCKGLWNGKSRHAELKCQHQDGTICTTNLRCVSGSCLDDTSIIISSASMKATVSILLVIGLLIMLV